MKGSEDGINHFDGKVNLAFRGIDDGQPTRRRVRAHHDEEIGEPGNAGAVVCLGSTFARSIPLQLTLH